MDARHYLTCLWPGLPELWWRGRLSALPAAVAFAVALNVLLVTRFLYPEWLATMLVRLGCWTGIGVWLFLSLRGARELPLLIAPRQASDRPDRFGEAHAAYVNADWSAAEELLADVLSIDPRDVPALLLLAAVYRHTERYEAAEDTLGQALLMEAADGWRLELDAERRRLGRDQSAARANEDAVEREGEETASAAESQPAAELTGEEGASQATAAA